MTTALEADEMIVEARIALLPQGTRFGFYEFSRRAGDFAQAMALATFSVQGGAITEARIGVGGVEAASRRVHEAEEALTGNAPSPVVFEAAAEAAARAVQPIDDPDKSETYCRGLVHAAVLRALQAAEVRAR
jgi:carbon-monoxide dehydrogenase medium subunit